MHVPRRTSLFTHVALSLASVACGHPCPDGVARGHVFVENNVASLSGDTFADGNYGDLETSGLMDCAEITAGINLRSTLPDAELFPRLRATTSITFSGAIADFPVRGFDALESLGALIAADEPVDLVGFSTLESIEAITVSNFGLASLAGCESLRTVGTLQVTRALDDAPCLAGVESFGAVSLTQSRLRDFDDFDGVRVVNGPMFLSGGDSMRLGFSRLVSVGGSLEITSLGVPSFDGFDSLETVAGDLVVSGLRSVDSEAISAWAQGVDVHGETIICGNAGEDCL